MISTFPLSMFDLYVVAFQQNLHINYIACRGDKNKIQHIYIYYGRMRQSWKTLLSATGLAGIVGYGSKLLFF